MKIGIISLAIIAILVMCAEGVMAQTKSKNKILVTYFSVPEKHGTDASSGASRIVVNDKLYGTTEYIAMMIREATGGDIFQIKTEHTYPSNTSKELVDYAKKELDTRTYPKIASKIQNFADYDTIFIGYPNWWFDMPMVIYTLFRDYNFSGKTVVLFCTHGGSGFSQSIETVKGLAKNAKVISIPAISNRTAPNARKGIENWLRDNKFTK